MHHKKVNYLKILKIEIEDLKDDIAFMIKGIEEGKAHGNISNHVFLENLSVLKIELLGVDTFDGLIDAMNTEDYENLEAMVSYLQEKIKTEVANKGLPSAIFELVSRKVQKVSDYIMYAEKH